MTARTIENDGGVTIVELHGSLMGGDDTDGLRQSLNEAVRKNCSRVLVDLTRVTYINSTAIGILMAAYATYARRQWRIVVCGLSKEVHAVFAITRMNQVYEVFNSREDALAHL